MALCSYGEDEVTEYIIRNALSAENIIKCRQIELLQVSHLARTVMAGSICIDPLCSVIGHAINLADGKLLLIYALFAGAKQSLDFLESLVVGVHNFC